MADLDIKKMTVAIAMAADRIAELNKRRETGTLTPEYEDSMMESVMATLQNATDLVTLEGDAPKVDSPAAEGGSRDG